MPDTALPPLIVTLTLDPAAQAWFDALRRTHFPPGRLVVGAHVTMFHALPGARESELAARMAILAAKSSPFTVKLTGLRLLGRGVAFTLSAPPAAVLRARLAAPFTVDLTKQDQATWSPHVTVQNKVTPEEAKQTYSMLSKLAAPDMIDAIGWALWRYRGGPWDKIEAWPF